MPKKPARLGQKIRSKDKRRGSNRQKSKSKKIAKPVAVETVTKTKNCLFCARFRKCNNQNKNWNFICERFKTLPVEQVQQLTIISKQQTERDTRNEETDDSDRFFSSQIDNSIKENSSPIPSDMRIDDRDIPEAANFYEFVTGKNFLDVKPFAKQISESILGLAEYCINPKCTDWDYLDNVPKRAEYDDILDKVTLLEYGKCPKCKRRKSEMYNDGSLKVPVELCGNCGQRSGKTAMVIMLDAYTIHRYLKLSNPSKFFGLLKNEQLHGKFVGLSYQKALDLIYSKLYGYLTDTPWFRQYHQLLDHYGAKMGEKLYSIKPTVANWRIKGLHIYPALPDKRKLRGDTSFLGNIDEIGWLFGANSNTKNKAGAFGEDSSITLSAKEIYTAQRNSFRTLRRKFYKLLKNGHDNVPVPLFANISSPSSTKDMITYLVNRSYKSELIHGFNYATWQFNPEFRRSDFREEFEENPIIAMRDFGAVPPTSSSPYIAHIEQLEAIVDRQLKNTVEFFPSKVISQSGAETIGGKVKIRAFDQNKRIGAIDPGFSGNSFSIVAGFLDEKFNRPIIDTLIEIQPMPNCPINHNIIFEEVISPMIEKLNIKFLVSDGWQNIKLLQDAAAEHGIGTEKYAVKYGDFAALRQDIYEGYISIPKPEMKANQILAIGDDNYPHGFKKTPIAHLLYQFVTVQDLGKEVIKGDGATDDILRALVLAYSFINDEEYAEFCVGKVNNERVGDPFGVVFGSRGSGGASSGGTNGNAIIGSNGRPIAVVSSLK